MSPKGGIRFPVNWQNQFTKKQQEILETADSPKVRQHMNYLIGKQMNYFVPRKSGALRNSMRATETGISWNTPYAHYQYSGYVYGPNKMLYNASASRAVGSGVIRAVSTEGSFVSPKGKTKYKTSRRLGESKDFDYWTTTRSSIYGGVKRLRVHFKMGYTTPNTGYEWIKKFNTSSRIKNANQSITYYLTHLKY